LSSLGQEETVKDVSMNASSSAKRDVHEDGKSTSANGRLLIPRLRTPD
jgi:hypothetical protein